jgi:hypothetical protein
VIGQHSSLRLDEDGRPHIAYTNSTANVARYARWDGTQWALETLSGARNYGTALALDAEGNPHIAYCAGAYDLVYVYQAEEKRYFLFLPWVVRP